MNTHNTLLFRLLTALGTILLILEGCSSSRGTLNFESLKYPVSMSAFLYDKHHSIVMKQKELKALHSFVFKKTFWTLGYGLIRLSSGEALSDSLNSIIEKYGGDGIINLSITIEQGVVNKIYTFFLFIPSYVPFFPGSADVTIQGEIVKLLQSGTSSNFDQMGKNIFVSKAEVPQYIKGAFDDIK